MEEKEEKSPYTSNEGERKDFTSAGKFAPGNQVAKGHNVISLDKQAVLQAMQEAGTRHGKAFIDFVFDKAYSNTTVLCKVLDKLVADVSLGIKTADIIGNTIILQFTNYKPELKSGAKEELKEADIVKDAIFESVENKGENGSLPPCGDKE